MATLLTLSGDAGPLTKISIPLGQGVLSQRSFYAFESVVTWMANEVPKMVCGRLNAPQSPAEQLDDILFRWIAGKEIRYSRMFQDLMPAHDEVWEHKRADLRIFGWMYKPRVFIAVRGVYADDLKGPNPTESYEDAKALVIRTRNELDLDEPKYTGGEFDALVRI